MPCHVMINPAHPVIEISFSGSITRFELADALRETLALAEAHDTCRILADCSQLAGGHSSIDLYYLAETVSTSGIAHRLKEAVLLPELPESSENVKFWETTCFNRGIRVSLFTDRQQALAWLITA